MVSRDILQKPDLAPFRTFFRETIKPPQGTTFEHTVEVFQLESDSNSRVIAFRGRSADGKQELMPAGLEVEYIDDDFATYLGKIASRILANVPVPVDTMANTMRDVLGTEPDSQDRRPLHERIVSELTPRINPPILGRYPIEKVDFSGL